MCHINRNDVFIFQLKFTGPVFGLTIFINKASPLPIHDRAEFAPSPLSAHPRIKQAPSCQILRAPRLSNSSPAFDRDPPSLAGRWSATFHGYLVMEIQLYVSRRGLVFRCDLCNPPALSRV